MNSRRYRPMLVLVALLAGCTDPLPIKKGWQEAESAAPASTRVHLFQDWISSGDTISIRFYESRRPSQGPYRLQAGDKVMISVADQPDLNHSELPVLPDGTLAVSLVGSLKVEGLDATEAATRLAEAYRRKQIRDPLVVVSVLQTHGKIAALLHAGRGSGDGEDNVLRFRIYDDSPIELPFIGVVVVTRSLAELRADVRDRYRAAFGDEVEVVVNFDQRADPTVYVMGEVKLPGTVPLRQGTSLIAAIAAVGGFAESADPKTIAVVRYDRSGNHQRWLFNAKAGVNDPRAPINDFALQVNDVVLIPRSGIANVNNWVDQYLRKNVPVNFGINYPIGIGQ